MSYDVLRNAFRGLEPQRGGGGVTGGKSIFYDLTLADDIIKTGLACIHGASNHAKTYLSTPRVVNLSGPTHPRGIPRPPTVETLEALIKARYSEPTPPSRTRFHTFLLPTFRGDSF